MGIYHQHCNFKILYCHDVVVRTAMIKVPISNVSLESSDGHWEASAG